MAKDKKIEGTALDDELFGTSKNDHIKGKRGDDILFGLWGDDKLKGDKGDDKLFGAEGADLLKGGKGADKLDGGEGDDELIGGKGDDELYGAEGADLLEGGKGADKLDGGEGNDELIGGKGDDELYGAEGDDLLEGGKGADKLDGGEGDDELIGGKGNDRLFGGTGKDRLFGDSDSGGSGSASDTYDDYLDGGADDDLVVGGQGNDTVLGGAGNDVLYGDSIPKTKSGKEHGPHHEKGSSLTFDDILDGGSGSDILYGGRGNDEARYSAGENTGFHDVYHGGSGVDTLQLNFTLPEWLALNDSDPKLQDDLTDYLAFLAEHTDPETGEADDAVFEFQSIGLDASQFENLTVFVDGNEINPEDEAVTAIDDSFLGSDGVIEDGDSISSTVIANDDYPDFFKEVRLVTDVGADKGVLNLNSDGTFEYDPLADFQYLGEGDEELVTFVYEGEDADGDVDQAEVTIMVTGVNDAPVALPASAAGNEDILIEGQLTATDVDNPISELTFSLVQDAANGSVIVNEDGSFSYLGDQDFSGPDAFQYRVADIDGGEVVATAEISVAAVADAPLVSVETFAGNSVNETRIVVTAQETDVDGSEFIESIFSDTALPANVSLVATSAMVETEPGTVAQEYLLTVPEDQDTLFDLTFTAISKEPSNNDTASASATLPVVYDYTATSSAVEFAANNESVWSTGEEFRFTDDRFFGIETGEFSETIGSEFYAGVSGDITLGFETSIVLEGGDIDATGKYDVTVETSYNKTTDQLFIDTAAALTETWFATLGPTGSFDLALLSDILISAYAGVNVDFGEIDFGPLGTLDLGGISQQVDLGGVDLPETTTELLSLTSSTASGEIPFIDPLGFLSIEFDWPDIVTSGTSTTSTATGTGESENFIQLVFDIDDIAATAYGLPFNPLDPPVPITAGPVNVSYDLLDLDIFGGLNFEQTFDLVLGNLQGQIVYENGTSQAFEFGDEITINDALSIDAAGNSDGIVDFEIVVAPEADLTNDTDLEYNIGIRPSVFTADIGYTLTIPNPFGDDVTKSDSTSLGPLATYTEILPLGDVDVYSDTFALDFEEQTFIYEV